MPKSPRVKFWQIFSPTWAKNAVKKWRNCSPIFVLQFPGKVGARNFAKNWRQFGWPWNKILSPRDSGIFFSQQSQTDTKSERASSGGWDGWWWEGSCLGCPDFRPKPWKNTAFFQGFGQKSGHPKHDPSHHHPSHPPLDALLKSMLNRR